MSFGIKFYVSVCLIILFAAHYSFRFLVLLTFEIYGLRSIIVCVCLKGGWGSKSGGIFIRLPIRVTLENES